MVMTITAERSAEFKALECAEARGRVAEDLLRYAGHKAAAQTAAAWCNCPAEMRDPARARHWLKNRSAFTNLAVAALIDANAGIARYGHPAQTAASDIAVLRGRLRQTMRCLANARVIHYVQRLEMIDDAEIEIHFTRQSIAALEQFIDRRATDAAE